LHFGDGPQAIHYFVFCLGAIVGAVQLAAVRYDRRDLIWIAERGGYVFGVLAIVGAYVWFLLTDDEIFIPGLAGGELFVVFVAALLVAVPVTRLVNQVLVRLRLLSFIPERDREEDSLA
jgi:hypothetical protein